MSVFGKMPFKIFASVVLPLEEHPLIAMTIAPWCPGPSLVDMVRMK